MNCFISNLLLFSFFKKNDCKKSINSSCLELYKDISGGVKHPMKKIDPNSIALPLCQAKQCLTLGFEPRKI